MTPVEAATTARAEAGSTLRRQYAKLCDISDFDAELRARIQEIVPGLAPGEEAHRKYWEYALLTFFLEDVGMLTDQTQALGIGAGEETVLFWLANRLGGVVATDIYGEGAFADREAREVMLRNPAAVAPYPYRTNRLHVAKMDGRALEFADGTFDFVFSLSSLEHFGGPLDVARGARELGRVLRPGGYAFVVTECFLGWHPLDSPLVQTAVRFATLGRRCSVATPKRRMLDVLTWREIRRRILQPSGLTLVQPVDRTVSAASWTNLARWSGAGEITPATGSLYPHVLLRAQGAPWTSIALPLQRSITQVRPA
jgi:SAM-dependent methyltransferase